MKKDRPNGSVCSAGKAFPIIFSIVTATVGQTFFDKFLLISFPVLLLEIVFNFRFLFIFLLVSCVQLEIKGAFTEPIDLQYETFV